MNKNSKELIDTLNYMSDFLIEQEFKDVAPIECLVQIMKANQKAKEKNEDN